MRKVFQNDNYDDLSQSFCRGINVEYHHYENECQYQYDYEYKNCIDDLSCAVERILKNKFKLYINNKEPLMLKGN